MRTNMRLYGRWGNRILAMVLLLGLCLVGVYASPPSWWSERGVTEQLDPADFAAANQGQVKWLATKAHEQFDAMVPGGAGAEIEALTGAFSDNNNYLAVNLGQLKAVAAPFYDRLWHLSDTKPYLTHAFPISMTEDYPWTSSTADDADYAIINVGQLKYAFSFNLDDADGDGLPDMWEIHYGLDPLDDGSTDPDNGVAGDPDDDGVINLDEYSLGRSPIAGVDATAMGQVGLLVFTP